MNLELSSANQFQPNPTESNLIGLIGLIGLIRPIILAAREQFGAIAAESANEESNLEL